LENRNINQPETHLFLCPLHLEFQVSEAHYPKNAKNSELLAASIKNHLHGLVCNSGFWD
jgi:hypothetical protein